MTMTQAMTFLIDELRAAWNAQDIQRLAALYAPEYEGRDVAQAEPERGPQGVIQTLARYLQAFPDLSFTLDEVIADDDRLALNWTVSGTHRGALMHIPPTGRAIEVKGVSIYTVANGKIVRGLFVWDVAGLLRSIGLLPEL